MLWTCETDNLRISSVSRLLSHSGLTTPHGTYTNLWFMQSKFPLNLSVITVWLHFSLLGSDIQFNQLTLSSGADQKALNWRWWSHCGDLTSDSVCTYWWPMVLYFKTVDEMWTLSVWRNEMENRLILWFLWISCCPQNHFSTTQALGHCSKLPSTIHK